MPLSLATAASDDDPDEDCDLRARRMRLAADAASSAADHSPSFDLEPSLLLPLGVLPSSESDPESLSRRGAPASDQAFDEDSSAPSRSLTLASAEEDRESFPPRSLPSEPLSLVILPQRPCARLPVESNDLDTEPGRLDLGVGLFSCLATESRVRKVALLAVLRAGLFALRALRGARARAGDESLDARLAWAGP
jgi:hypothetical protein